MSVAAAGAIWAAIVAWLLWRAVRQARAHRRGSLGPPSDVRLMPAVAFIVPARNERDNIGPCLQGLRSQSSLADYRIVVVDDESHDGTAQIVQRLAATDPRITLIEAGALPAGWLGKPHACWRGALATDAERLCFIDADVRLTPALAATALAEMHDSGADMLSLAPFQELGSFWERLIVPAGLVLIGCALDLRRINDPAAPEVSANGQVMLIRRSAYFALGGHAAVCSEVCEDKALAGLVKRAGLKYRLLGAEHLASTRMYRDLPSLWQGFSKNAVELVGGQPATLALATAGFCLAWCAVLIPAVLAPILAGMPSAAGAAGLAIASAASLAVLGIHIGTARHLRIPLGYGFLFPLAHTAVAAIAWHSVELRRIGRVSWKGRVYQIDGN